MPVGAGQGNWMPSCRSAPGSPGTWTAKPRGVPPPNAGRVGLLARLIQFLLATPDMRLVSGFGDGPVAGGIVVPLVQAQWAPSTVHHYALQRRLEELRIVDIGSGHHHAQWPACPVDQDAFLAPSLAPVRGIASNSAPPKRAFPIEQSADCHSQSTPSSSRHSSIRTAQIPSSTPRSTHRWKVLDGAVIPQLLGQVVPLAGAQTKDDALQHLPLVHPFAPFGLGGSNSKITGSSLPKIIWYFPYRWQSLPLSHHSPPHNFPLS